MLALIYFLFYEVKIYGEMAEWSNAVDSKSIVLFTGYLGFESLSLRHLLKPRFVRGFSK